MHWEAGPTNFGDFHTKHHLAVHHKVMRPLHTHIGGPSPESLQGCVKMMKNVKLSEALNLNTAVASTRGTRWMTNGDTNDDFKHSSATDFSSASMPVTFLWT